MNQKTLASAIAFTIGGAAVFSAPSMWAGFQPPVNAAPSLNPIEVAKNDITPLYYEGKEVYSKNDMMVIGGFIGKAYCQNESHLSWIIPAGMYAMSVNPEPLPEGETLDGDNKSHVASIAYSILKQTDAGKCENIATVSGFKDWAKDNNDFGALERYLPRG